MAPIFICLFIYLFEIRIKNRREMCGGIDLKSQLCFCCDLNMSFVECIHPQAIQDEDEFVSSSI